MKKKCDNTMDLFSCEKSKQCLNSTQGSHGRIINMHEVRQSKTRSGDNTRSLIMGAFIAHAKKLGW